MPADNAQANLDATKIHSWRTGNVWTCDPETPAPTSASWTPVEGVHTGLGHLGQAGQEETMSADTQDIVVLQDNQTVDSYVTGSTHEISFEFMETNIALLEMVLGTTVDTTTGGYVYNAGATKPRLRFIAVWIDRRTGKLVLKSWIGAVTDPGTITYNTVDTVTTNPTTRVYGNVVAFDTALIQPAAA